jgi:N-acetylglutamate synthase-like GNAT family acetyltransferase
VRYTIRIATAEDVAACERILRSLPEWFGIESAIVSYVRAIPSMETFLADVSGSVVGFITLATTSEAASEIHVMAIAREHHRSGLGRALVEHAEAICRDRGVEYLHVKTLGPSRPNAEYAATRAFYRRMGFRPLEENALWGAANPCLMLLKHLS